MDGHGTAPLFGVEHSLGLNRMNHLSTVFDGLVASLGRGRNGLNCVSIESIHSFQFLEIARKRTKRDASSNGMPLVHARILLFWCCWWIENPDFTALAVLSFMIEFLGVVVIIVAQSKDCVVFTPWLHELCSLPPRTMRVSISVRALVWRVAPMFDESRTK